ncbi:MAG TPA: hypothetical protein DC000_06970 [Clostridiales bacterium]|nr:hypothetical protein [Clostridiales bacterium]
MKALICYDTKYGSTNEICKYIKSGIKMDTDIKKVCEVDSLDYDIIIIGSPIFIGKPMRSIENFIINNKEKLRDKKIAVFVTCWAMATKYGDASKEFLNQIKKNLPPSDLICEKALPGKLLLDKISEKDKLIMGRLLRRIDAMSGEFDSKKIVWRDARDRRTAEDFGSEIENSFKKKFNIY